jgi:hypothetical protein
MYTYLQNGYPPAFAGLPLLFWQWAPPFSAYASRVNLSEPRISPHHGPW